MIATADLAPDSSSPGDAHGADGGRPGPFVLWRGSMGEMDDRMGSGRSVVMGV